jgi:hypothetical protein
MRFANVIAAVFVSLSLTATADARVKLKEACGADIDKFCKDMKKGTAACLRTHATELQPGCSDALKQRDAEKAAKQPS